MPSATTVDNTAAPAGHLWILGWILTSGCTSHTPQYCSYAEWKTQHSVISPICLFIVMFFTQTPLPNIISFNWSWHCMFCLKGDVAKRHRKVGFHCGLEEKLIYMVRESGSFGNGSPAPWFCRFALRTLCRCKSFEIDFVLCCFGWVFFFSVFLSMHSSSYYII